MRVMSDTEMICSLVIVAVTVIGTTAACSLLHPIFGGIVLCTWITCFAVAVCAGIKDQKKDKI